MINSVYPLNWERVQTKSPSDSKERLLEKLFPNGWSGGRKLLKAGLVVNVLWRLSKSHVHVQSDCSWILRDSQRNIMKAFYLNAKSRRGWRREKSLYIQDVETINFPAENHHVSVWNEPECCRESVRSSLRISCNDSYLFCRFGCFHRSSEHL